MTSTQISAPRRGRRILTGLSAMTLAVVLSGCAALSPMSTQEPYNPGDGVSLDLGDVAVRDLVVVGTAEGEPATVLAFVVNSSPDDVTVTIASEGAAPATVDVPAGSATQISPAGEEGVVLESLGVALGAMLPLTVQLDGDPPAQIAVPTVSTSDPVYTDFEQGEG